MIYFVFLVKFWTLFPASAMIQLGFVCLKQAECFIAAPELYVHLRNKAKA